MSDKNISYEFKQYVDYVESTLISKLIPKLLDNNTLANRMSCYHYDDEFASFIIIPPELRKHKLSEEEIQYKTLKHMGVELEPDYEEEMEKMLKGEILRRDVISFNKKELERRFEAFIVSNMPESSHKWRYAAAQHNGNTENLNTFKLLFDPGAYNLTKEDLDGLDRTRDRGN